MLEPQHRPLRACLPATTCRHLPNCRQEHQRTDIEVVLVHPQIPQNSGNIARTCAATNVPLHLVGPLGFELDSKKLKRAGLDYWPKVGAAGSRTGAAGGPAWQGGRETERGSSAASVAAAGQQRAGPSGESAGSSPASCQAPCCSAPAAGLRRRPARFHVANHATHPSACGAQVCVEVHPSWEAFMDFWQQQPGPKQLVGEPGLVDAARVRPGGPARPCKAAMGVLAGTPAS